MAISSNTKESADFNVFSGAENGILKCVSINSKANLLKNFNHNSSPLDREQEITCLEWGQENETELLVGLRCQTVKVFDVADKTFTSCVNVKAGSGPLRGVAKFDDTLVTACESGLVRLWRAREVERLEFNAIDIEAQSSGKLKAGVFETEEAKEKHLATIKAGRQLCRMRHIPSTPNMIATAGKENRLQLWDLARPDVVPVFSAKNVKHDKLELRVPVWVTDICFPDALTPSSIATVSRHGHIRLYDTRLSQRRPVHNLIWENEALTSVSATNHTDQILVGSGTGNLALFDFRAEHRGMFRKYKGCVGSIRSIYCLRDKPYFAVAGLDRFLRIFNINTQKAVHKMYLKSRLNTVLLSQSFEPCKIEVEAEVETKTRGNADDIRPEVEVVGEQDDERFWAKIPVIREKKKRGNQKDLLGRACLTYLLHCHEILMRISRMPQRPVFGGTHRIHASNDEKPATVDPTIPYMKVVSFDVATDTMSDHPFTFEALQTNVTCENNVLLRDNAHGLFRLWFILVDGLCSCISICAKGYQSSAIESLFAILSSFQLQDDQVSEGVPLRDVENLGEFGLFLTNHVLLPMLQNWLRKCGHSVHEWAVSASSFKQCMGKTTELVMAWFSTSTTTISNFEASRTLVLKQLVILLVECTVVPVESIARLGCSCFRHIIVCGSSYFNEALWDILCLSLCRATQVTLYPLHQLMSPFERGSTNFYGDVADVKVAARKDSNRKENHRLQQLAQQVLLLDQQRGDIPKMPANPDAEERSFLFLLHPPSQFDSTKGSGTPLRVALRSLITGLTANQLILQIIGKVLLQGTTFSIPGLTNILFEGDSTNLKKSGDTLPGYLSVLTDHQVKILLSSLRSTYEVAMEFDSRPGLKFLLQKVTQLDNAANLYKTAGAAWCISLATLFHLSLRNIRTEPKTLAMMKEAMKDRIKEQNTCKENNDSMGGEASRDILSSEMLLQLHDEFIDIVETYADIVADKDGQRARLDMMVGQKLYFLSIEPPPPEIDSPVLPETETKPFSFSDFAKGHPIRRVSSSQLSEPNGCDSPIRGHPSKIRVDKLDKSDKSVEYYDEEDEEVFSMTTQTEKDSMVSEFRNRKGKRVLPFSTGSAGDGKSPAVDRRKNPFSFTRTISSNVSDPDIAAQQKKSLMVDSEAQTKVWTDLALASVQLSTQLSDEQLRSFLPVIFPGLKLLMIHAEGSGLKLKLAELMARIGALYEFSFETEVSSP